MVEVHECKVPGCTNKSDQQYFKSIHGFGSGFGNGHFPFYRFPTDTFRKNKWLEFCNLPLDTNSFIISKYKICSQHFAKTSFKNFNQLRSYGKF